MNYYLIDYENIKDLQGIENLKNTDTVTIFYTTNANTLTFQNHKKIVESKAIIEYKEVESGTKNALDFQLGTYLGYLIGKNDKSSKYNILSRDHDYDHIISFWKNEKDITVGQLVNLSGETKQNQVKEKTDQITSLLKNKQLALTDEQINQIIDIVIQYKTKVAINNNLNKSLKDSEKVGKILKVIKPFIKDKK